MLPYTCHASADQTFKQTVVRHWLEMAGGLRLIVHPAVVSTNPNTAALTATHVVTNDTS